MSKAFTLIELMIVSAIISAIASIVVSSMIDKSEKKPDTRPYAKVEADSEIVLGDKWTGKIVVLPTGERVLLTRLTFTDANGWNESTAAVLLPPLKAEKP